MADVDYNHLIDLLKQLVGAGSPTEARRIIEEHPELLSNEVDAILLTLIFTQSNKDAEQTLSFNRDLLEMCRIQGIEATFAMLTQPAQPSTDGQSLPIPAGFEDEMQEVIRLSQRAETDMHALQLKVALIESLLERAEEERYPAFRAGLLSDLGNTYQMLPTSNKVADLQKAITCYREALRFRTPEAYPFDFARTQSNLGAAYLSLADESPDSAGRVDNQQQAVICFQAALSIYTPETAPSNYIQGYAASLRSLADTYAELPTRNQAADLQQAVSAYEEALRFTDPTLSPIEYARTQYGLGRAHTQLPTGDKSVNLPRAILCYETALSTLHSEAAGRVQSEGTDLLQAAIQEDLGTTCLMLPTGNRVDNLQRAIGCFETVLSTFAPQATGMTYSLVEKDLYSAAQHGMGVAYRNLTTGDQSANLYRAIQCFQEALRFLNREESPAQYGRTLNDIGNAFADLLTGDRVDNLRQAIRYYEQALTIILPGTNPTDYVTIQGNLGIAYIDMYRANGSTDLNRAIGCFREALRFCSPIMLSHLYAGVQSNLGLAYQFLPTGDRAANLLQAIACYRAALTIYTPEAAPFAYAKTQNILGTAYQSLPTGDRSANLQQAIACYRAALTVYTPETAPDDHRRTAGNLGHLYFAQSLWEEAHNAYAPAIATAAALYQAAATEISRQAELAEGANLVPNDAWCLAKLDRFAEAVERLEADKAHALTEALARNQAALQGAKPEDQAAFAAARNRIRELEVETRAMSTAHLDQPVTRSFTEISSDLHTARQILSEVVNHIHTYLPEFMPAGLTFEAIAAAAAPNQPLVYLLTTTHGSLALIVPSETKTLNTEHAVWLDDFSSDDLVGLLVQTDTAREATGGYLVEQVAGDGSLLQAALDQILPILSERIIGPLAAHLAALGFRQATLIAGGHLSLLPLHVGAFDTMMIICAPSARVLQSARNAARERANQSPVFLGIGNPLPNPKPLAFARAEVEAIAPLFAAQAQRVLYERQATREDTLKQLPGATHLHFSCHGAFNIYDPLDSALFLAGKDTVTLRDLLDGDLDLSAARLAVLSACQTGIIDFRQVPDETIGLPAGFLQAGVPSVVSTLWSVADISTALLLVRFYRHHLQNNLDPATALHQAQAWLRTATAAELNLANWYERAYEASGRKDQYAFKAMRYYRANPDVKPFTHPYFWAGFIFTGV